MRSRFRNSQKFLVIPLAACVVAMVSGCAQNSSFQSGGSWHEDNVVAQDLAAQVANKQDLFRGHGQTALPSQALVGAITSWETAMPPVAAPATAASLNNLNAP